MDWLVFVVFVLTTYVTLFRIVLVTWTCGLCGKRNTTSLFKFLFCMCDHTGTGNGGY